jgi:carbamoyltransferase
MNVLGIVGGTRQGYQDCSAVLAIDGKIISAIEEERLLRIKHAPGLLPERAIRQVLKINKLTIKDIDLVVTHGITWKPDFRLILKDFFISKFEHSPDIELVNHHDAHAASAFFGSGFEESMILTTDLSGDGISTKIATGKGTEIKFLRQYERPNSLGVYYALLTEFCGFQKDNDEYKVMGLSSYGDRSKHDFSWLLSYRDGEYSINMDYIKGYKPGEPGPSKQVPLYSENLIKKLGKPRNPESEMSDYYADIAASGQKHLEDVIENIITKLHKDTGIRKVCLAGGVALNVVVNQRLMNLDFIDEIYIQPAANDAGVSIGAAYLGTLKLGGTPKVMENAYLGTEFSNDEIEEALKLANVNYRTTEEPAAFAAKAVADNKIVGWFQGKMEFGPRALGSRSILANPTNKDMKDIVNIKVKFREQFRPFCPSVLIEDSPLYFDGKSKTAPYMTITYDVNKQTLGKLPSITHVDNTARIQTVDSKQHPLYYDYLKELKKHTGFSVTLNTSYNVKGEPIIHTPINGIATFFGSGMEVLVMGNYIVEK